MADRYASLKQGLVGCWIPSISGSGLLLPDLSGRGNNGVLTNMSPDDWVSASYGRALDFDGVNDWVLMQGTQNAYNVGSGDFALFTWFRSTAAGTQSIFLLDNNSTGNGLILFAFGNILRTWVAGVRTDSTTVINDGAWKHVGMVRRSGTVTQYINGIAGNTFTSAGSALTGQTPRIGSYDGSNFMLTGQVDDARFYSRALTEPEIRLLASEPGIGFKPTKKLSRFSQRYTYKPPKARNYSVIRVKETDYGALRQGLVGAWCPSVPNGGSGNTLPDLSGRGNNGSLVNMDASDWVSSQYGRALDFDGVNDYVSVSNNPSIRPVDGLTVAFWLFLNNVSGVKYFVDNQSGSPFYGYTVAASNNKLVYNAAYNVNLVDGLSNANLVASRWIHVAVTYDKQNLIAYFDGVLDRNQTATGAIDYTVSQDLSISARQANRLFHSGQLDDIRLYSRALTEPEIRLLASRPGIGLRQDRDRNTFYQFPSFQPALARRSSAIIGGGIT